MSIDYAARIKSLAPSAIREILKVTQDPSVISFAAGNPAAAAFPAAEMAEIAAELFATKSASALQYGITEGYAPLRSLVLDRMRLKYSTGTSENDDIIITTGGQQGIELTAKVFLNEGDTIICEDPSFVGALNAFRSYGAHLTGIPVLSDGIDTEALEAALKADSRVKLLYVIPTFQNPSGVTMSLEKRRELLRLAEKYDFLIIEDSPYFELRYSGEYVQTLKSLDRSGRVIFTGSFSKIIAPGIRVGFCIADKAVISKITVAKQVSDVHTNLFFQMLIAEYMQRFDLDAHIAGICKMYTEKRDAMMAAIGKYLPSSVSVHRPDGGLFIWGTLPTGFDGMELCRRASKLKVAAVPGASFSADESAVSPSFRMNFSLPTFEQIDAGMAILGDTAEKYISEGIRE